MFPFNISPSGSPDLLMSEFEIYSLQSLFVPKAVVKQEAGFHAFLRMILIKLF
jgi:hypothetical protein